MAYLFLAIYIILIGIILFGFWKGHLKNQLIYILALGFIIRVYGMMVYTLGEWDERFHALVAKNFIKNPFRPILIDDDLVSLDPQDWSMCDVWLAKPPLPLWHMALGMKIFGINEIGLRFPSLIFSLVSIYITYLIGRKLFNDSVGLMASFFYAINGLLYEINIGKLSGDHVDTLFHLFFQLSILSLLYFAEIPKRKYLVLIGILTGLAFLCKWIMAFFILFICFVYLIFSERNFKTTISYILVIGLVFILMVSPWLVWIFYLFPSQAHLMLISLVLPINTVVQEHNGGWYYYLNAIRIYINEFIYFPLLLLVCKLYRRKSNNKLLLFIWIFIPLLLFSITETKREVYIMVAAAPLFILMSWFILFLSKVKMQMKFSWLKTLFILSIFVLCIRYSLERIKPLSHRLLMPTYRLQMEHLINEAKVPADSLVLISEPHYLEARFYYGIKGYRYVDDSSIEKIKQKGYQVFEWVESNYVKK